MCFNIMPVLETPEVFQYFNGFHRMYLCGPMTNMLCGLGDLRATNMTIFDLKKLR